MTTFLSIERNETELLVEVDSEAPGIGYVDESVGSFAKDQPIQLTQKEQDDAEERLLTAALCLAKRDIDFEVDTMSGPEMDRAADRHLEQRNRR